MIGLIATMKAKRGFGALLAQEIAKPTAQIREQEPGTILYQPMCARDDPDTVVVLEIYASQEALDNHVRNAFIAQWRERIDDLKEGDATLQFLEMP